MPGISDLKNLHISNKPLIIAEIGQNHDGSLGMCHAYIDALADIGVDAIKFQTHIAAEESTRDENFRVKFSYQDETRYDYWRRMEFSASQWFELKRHADAKGLGFLSTPFSVAAVQLLEKLGVDAWKVGSGDTAAKEMLEPMLASGKPVVFSTGMSDWLEIDSVVSRLKQAHAPFALMQCTSKYPTPLEDVGLNVLDEMKKRYGCRVGLSDHSGKTAPAVTALARGFNLIEVHATFDKRMFGPDVSASLTLEEIKSIVSFSNDVCVLAESQVDKDEMARSLRDLKELFGRSVALSEEFPAGHVLTRDDLVPKKPGDGIPWAEKDDVVGKVLKYAVTADRLLKPKDLD